MKTRFKFSFNCVVLYTLLIVLLGFLPVSHVQAEEVERPLYVNNNFVWAKNMGGGLSEDAIGGISLDASRNVYTSGSFIGTVDFDPGLGTFNLSSKSDLTDVFISKVDNNGNFVWAKSMGGTSYDEVRSLVVDSSGNVYTTGGFQGTADYDPSVGIYNLNSAGAYDIFISKLDSSGNFVWAKSIGGAAGWDMASSIALDSSGNSYITGGFVGVVDFDPGPAVFTLNGGLGGTFVSKLDSDGNFVWAKSIGGLPSTFVGGADIAVDSSNKVYITGNFNNTIDFDPGPGVFNLSSIGGIDFSDVFVLKLDADGNFIWAKSMGGSGNDYGYEIIVASDDTVYSTGRYSGVADFDPNGGIYNLTSISVGIFISKLGSDGSFIWADGLSGADNASFGDSRDIILDTQGSVYITGSFGGTIDFDPGLGIFNLNGGGAFISKVDSNGAFVWAKNMVPSGSASYSGGTGIALDFSDNVYIVGDFSGTVDFNPGAGLFNLTSIGEADIFVSKLGESGASTFVDVPLDHPLYKYIQALYDAGYTAGCSSSPLMFCPDTILDRAQSAVFMLRGQKGSGYTPPAITGIFGDNWTGFEWAQGWAEGMYQEGLTTGCQTSPLLFCPANQLPRVEASIFGLRMKYGVAYAPPAATGTVFADFPSTDPSYWGIDWAEQAYKDGLLPACGTDSGTGKPMFCPGELVNRGWGAYLIVKAKGLPTP